MTAFGATQRKSTLRTVHDPGGRGLTPHNVSLPFISALGCIGCQCQKPPIFHLVMRSDLQTRSQQTTLLSTVRVVIELYLLAASATWTIKRLSASSCEQEASPSMSLGCRKMTSLSIVQMTLSFDLVTIYLPTQCQLYVLYPVAVTHTVGTHHGHYDSQKVPASACFSTYKTASPSNTTTSTLVSSFSSGASSRHRTMSDLVHSLSFPLTDSYGGHG